MSKILKITGRITGGLLEWVLILFIIFAFAIRTSPVQTFLAQQVTNYLSKELATTFRIDRVSIIFFHKVALDGVFVLDQKKDTIASIETVFVTLKEFNQSKNLVALDEVNLKGGVVKISRAKGTGEYNYGFIQDYFASDSKKTKKDPMSVTLDHLRLSRVNVSYDDFRKDYSPFGMDYDHLKFKNVYLFAGGFSSKKGVIGGFIKHISFREKGGFELNKFSTYVNISDKGLRLKNLRIKTPFSHIHMAKMNLLMNEMADLQSFEDSVDFDVRIDRSLVSLKDISYFGTALEGMDQVIALEADVSNKVKNLKIANLNLSTGKKTKLQGTINLPDFREFDQAFFQEKISYAYVSLEDLQAIKLPKKNSSRYISLNETVRRLGYFEATDLKIDGFYSQFVVESDKISTALGSVRLDHGVMFSENKAHNSFMFEESQASEYDVKIDSFQLGRFLDQSILGSISGTFFMNGEIFSSGGIDFNSIKGELSRVDFMDYPYSNIHVKEASFKKNIFDGLITIEDENLQLTYDGFMDLNRQQHFDFDVSVDYADLKQLKLMPSDTSIILSTSFSADLSGTGMNNYSGSVSLDSLMYSEGSESFDIPRMLIQLDRSPEEDILSVRSKIANITARGKVDFKTIGVDFNNQFSAILPAFFTYKKPQKAGSVNHFNYNITVQDVNDLLAVFVAGLEVSPGTTISGDYNGQTDDFSMNLVSPQLKYNNFKATGVNLSQRLNDSLLSADYRLESFSINDTLRVNLVTFITTGSKGKLNSTLKWNPETTNESSFAWSTEIKGLESFLFELQPSYFSINEHRWDIEKTALITYAPQKIDIDQFLMRRENQFISLDGSLSNAPEENLMVKINDFQLDDFSSLIGLSAGLQGVVNSEVTISNPFENLSFNGTAKVSKLYVNNAEVGDVNLSGLWDKTKESIALKGDLYFKQNKTFNFEGNYYLTRKNSLDFFLDFDRTDIQFVNAFLDPLVVSNIRGLVEGKLHITGSPQKPDLDGSVHLLGGNVKVQMFGVNFGFNGRVDIDEDMIKIDNMPIIDEEGNTGAMSGQVYHNNFSNWNFDLFLNLEDYFDAITRRWMKVDNFLVMNTEYKEGTVYYGKAYATGNANISGYADNLEIVVNMKTQRNTTINFPMYGTSDIEEQSFITFVSKDSTIIDIKPEIDLTGVDLDLNFTVTPDAAIKLIFDDVTGDEITAYGRGDIGIKLDNLGDLSMDGTFTVTGGEYNFVLGVLRKRFSLRNGGTITWTGGGATDASLAIKTVYTVTANVNELVPELESQKSSGSNQVVECYLSLTGSLSNPVITFEIAAPKASESGKAAIARINSDPDELNKQFFSLLLGNKFQPLAGSEGSIGTGSGAALDMLSSQINTLLGQVSKDVRINVALDNDEMTGENSVAVGFQKNVLNDKLTVKGSFGVENNAGGTNQSALIGDINLEYTLDDNGNFKVNIFNESNDYTVIQDKNLGQFTQGVGLLYQEEFQSVRDFRLLQRTLDLFRTNKRIKSTKKRREKPVPPLNSEQPQPPKEGQLPEEPQGE